jgi:hypothetical protein
LQFSELQPQEPNVEKTYARSFSCDKLAKDIYNRMRAHFPQLANFKGNFGIGNSAYASVEFGKTTIAKGANISIDSVVEGPSVPGTYQQPIYIDTAVKVQSVTTQLGEKGSTNWIGFTFETVPGHVLNPATISFQMQLPRSGTRHVRVSDSERSARANRKVAQRVQRGTATRVSGPHDAQRISSNPNPRSL